MGYRIPKGAWVIANVWYAFIFLVIHIISFVVCRAVLHDPTVFRDPEEFRPERFEDTKERPAEPDIVQAAFGFGRR